MYDNAFKNLYEWKKFEGIVFIAIKNCQCQLVYCCKDGISQGYKIVRTTPTK